VKHFIIVQQPNFIIVKRRLKHLKITEQKCAPIPHSPRHHFSRFKKAQHARVYKPHYLRQINSNPTHPGSLFDCLLFWAAVS